jgi:hypothetical protein
MYPVRDHVDLQVELAVRQDDGQREFRIGRQGTPFIPASAALLARVSGPGREIKPSQWCVFLGVDVTHI